VTTPLFDFVAATYASGYQENQYDGSKQFAPEKWIGAPDKSVSHTRRVLYLKPGYALVLDTLDGTGQHVYEAHFDLNVASARLDPATDAAYAGGNGAPLLALFPLDRDNLQSQIVTGQKNPMLGWGLGAHRPAPALSYSKSQPAPAIFSTFLYPTPGPEPTLSADPLNAGAGSWARRLKTGTEEMEVAVALDGTPHALAFSSDLAGPVNVQAAGFVVRRAQAASAFFVGGWGVQSYDDGTLKFTLAAPGAIVAERDGPQLLLFNPSSTALDLTLAKPYARTITLPPGEWRQIEAQSETTVPTPTALP
jgi:hypothetical protein